jgi:hypothetical protein
MQFKNFSFGSVQIDESTYERDIVLDRGEVRKRIKQPSKRFCDEFGHTPLSIEEKIPWRCQRLVIGTGAYGRLPVMEDVRREAKRRDIELLILPTREAIRHIEEDPATNAISTSRVRFASSVPNYALRTMRGLPKRRRSLRPTSLRSWPL